MIEDLKRFAEQSGIVLAPQRYIADEAAQRIADEYGRDALALKANFDQLIDLTEKETYAVYLEHEKRYGERVFTAWVDHLRAQGALTHLDEVSAILGDYFHVLDKFYLSLSQSRRSRAGRSFEVIQQSLFKRLGYPFDEQPVVNGKPDFVMPSVEHYRRNPMDCIIYTSKRTLRERWRQIVTEGVRAYGFFLATIDEKVSSNQLEEMLHQKIYVVVPLRLKETIAHYQDAPNVLSFQQFFIDRVDPSIERWKRNGVI